MVPVGLGGYGPAGIGWHNSSPIRSWDEPGTWRDGNAGTGRDGNAGTRRDQHPGAGGRWHRAPAAAACQLGEAGRC
jgi:hypothetical protein